jgi:hypothetical protein
MSQSAKTTAGPVPPDTDQLTAYDQAHLVTYLRLLDADAAGADWQTTARLVLSLNPAADLDGARLVYDAHLARARWMTRAGYHLLLK